MEIKGSKELFEEVVDAGLCTFCGGCAGGCPYLLPYQGRIVLLDNCTRSEGQCYQYCPRTYTDMDAVSQKVFGVPFSKDEVGIVKEIFLARSTDAEIHQKGQYGGTISALLSLVLEERFIDYAVCSKMSDDKTPGGFLARNREELLQCAGNSYEAEASPVLETYNHIPKDSTESLGIVGSPCQVVALTKMKLYPPQNRVNINNVKLVIGAFCAGKKLIKPGEIKKVVMPTCSYCMDMTAEFADISVGVGGRQFLGWNNVIIRTKAGAELMDIARKKGAVETQPIPIESLTHLKKVALNKKKRALSNIIAKTGDKKNLLYLGLSESMVNELLA